MSSKVELNYFAVRIPKCAKETLRKLVKNGKVRNMSTFAREVLVEKLRELDCYEG
jgi:hypothetical protein